MRLLFIAPSTRAMAESAKRAGYDFLTLDFFGDVDQKGICENYSLREMGRDYNIESLAEASKTLSFTHAVYGAGFENHPGLVEELEDRSVVLGNSSETLRRVRDWRFFFKTMKKIGVLFPETEVLTLEKAGDLRGKIVKPIRSRGGRNVFMAQEAGLKEGEFLLQEFIEGKAVSTSVLCSQDECIFIGATEQLIGDVTGKFRYCGNIAPAEIEEELEEITIKIAEAFKLKGSNGIDFIVSEGPYVLEVNPRLTGAMEVIEKAYDLNLVDLHIRACLGGVRLKRSKDKFYGRKIIYAPEDLRFNVRAPSFIKDVPGFNERIKKGGPVCTVMGSGETREECYRDLMNKEKRMHEDLRQGYI